MNGNVSAREAARSVLVGSWSWSLAKRKAAMMAFCEARSTCKVSMLFFHNCDWVCANFNHGNELENIQFIFGSFRTSRRTYKVFFQCVFVSTLACFVLSTKMSKLSFRARALDASKPMPVYLAEELPDLPDYSAINRAVPQMPSGMEKEEECVSIACF